MKNKMSLSAHKKSYIYIAIAVLSWSTVATAFKIALNELTYFELLLISSATAMLFFAGVLVFTGKISYLKQINKKNLLHFSFVALLNPVAYYLVLFKAYSLLPAQVAQPVNYAWPVVLVLFLAVYERKAIQKIKYIGLIISLTGVVLISLGAKSSGKLVFSYFGLFLAAFSALLWATYWIASERIKIDKTIFLFFTFFFGTIYLILLIPFMEFHLPEKQSLLSGIYVGLFEMGVPFLFFGLAIKYTNNHTLTNQLCYLSPFLSLILINYILKEKVLFTSYTGLMLIVIGILFNQYFIPFVEKIKK